jgi:hypothetical protein
MNSEDLEAKEEALKGLPEPRLVGLVDVRFTIELGKCEIHPAGCLLDSFARARDAVLWHLVSPTVSW